MAVMPDVNISTRQIETAPTPHYFQSLNGENGRAIGGAISYTGNALDRIWEVQRRERERAKAEAERQAEKQRIEMERAQRAHEVSVNRDAEYLNNQCENYLANSLVGHMETDPATGEQKEVKGKWSKSYAELESEKTSLPKLTEEAVREMREEQWYKDASPEVRAAAERKFVFTRDRWMRKSVEEHARLKQADAVEKMKKNVEFNLNGAAATFGSKQEVVDPRTGAKVPTYQYAAVRAGLKNFGALQGTEIENPEILDNPTARFEDLKWSRKLTDEQLAEKRDQYNDCVYQIYVNRIGALQKAGASGLALGEYSPSACLDEADKMTNELHGMKRIRKAADGSDIPVVNDEQFNAIKAETEKCRASLKTIDYRRKCDNYKKMGADISRLTMDTKDPKKSANCKFNLEMKADELTKAVERGEIEQSQAQKLYKDYQAYARQVFYTREGAILAETDEKKRKEMYLAEAKAFEKGDPKFAKAIAGVAARTNNANIKGDPVTTRDIKAKAAFCLVPPENATEEQMKEWLDCRRSLEYEYREAFAKGSITPETYKQVMADLNKSYDEDDMRAINFFDTQFGFGRDRGYEDYKDVSAHLTSLKNPQGAQLKKITYTWEGNEYDVKVTDLREYRNKFLALLAEQRKANPTADSTKLAKECYETIKSLYVRDRASMILGAMSTRSGTTYSGLDIAARGIDREETRLKESAKSEIGRLYKNVNVPQSVRDLAPSLVDLDDGKDADEEAEAALQ